MMDTPSRSSVAAALQSAKASLGGAAAGLLDLARLGTAGPAPPLEEAARALDCIWIAVDDVRQVLAALDGDWRREVDGRR